jgi:5'-nucleotidase
MNILITNDDGIHAPGLWMLYQWFSKNHQVTVVAPDRERSAAGHGITLHEPLRAEKVTVNNGYLGYAVNGTPVDCIRLGLLEILDNPPDMILSGINPGANVGVDINYSGTVAAAREAGIYGIAAIAVSVQGKGRFICDDVGDFILRLAENIHARGLSAGTILNVNIPDLPMEKILGTRISHQEIQPYYEHFEKRFDPRQRAYYWQGCGGGNSIENSDSDIAVLGEHYISVTPIKCDTTDYAIMDRLKAWGFDPQ